MAAWSLHSRYSHYSTIFSNSSFDLCSSLQIAWLRNQKSLSMSLGKKLVVQVDPWLNQQWSSWPWPSSSSVRLWASSPLELEPLYSCRCPIHFLQRDQILPCLEVFQAYHQADVIYHFEMRTSNANNKGLDLTDLRCLSWFRSWLI